MKIRWGQSIRQQRQFCDMTQVKLAKILGVDQTAVSAWERGAKAPSIENQLAIARALGIDARILFAYPDAA